MKIASGNAQKTEKKRYGFPLPGAARSQLSGTRTQLPPRVRNCRPARSQLSGMRSQLPSRARNFPVCVRSCRRAHAAAGARSQLSAARFLFDF